MLTTRRSFARILFGGGLVMAAAALVTPAWALGFAAAPGKPGKPGRPGNHDICETANPPAICRENGCCHIHKIKTWVVINGKRRLRYVRRWHCHGPKDRRHCLKYQRR